MPHPQQSSSEATSPPHTIRSPRAAHPRQPEGTVGETRDERLEDAITAARDAALVAFKTVLDADPETAPEVRVMLCATLGNPSTETSQTEVRFASPDGVAISHHDKIAISLASMKAVSPPIYATMMAGIERGQRATLRGLRACFRAATR